MSRFLLLILASTVGCVNASKVQTANHPVPATAPSPTVAIERAQEPISAVSVQASEPIGAFEYGEVRWETGDGPPVVWLERPGDQFKGEYFQDALDYATLPRPMPSNTEKGTSSDLLTMLSTEGWQVVSHSMVQVSQLHVEVWTIRRPMSKRPTTQP